VAEVGGNDRGTREAIAAAARVFEAYGGFIRAVIRFQAGRRLDEGDLFQEFFLVLVHKPVPSHVRNTKSFLYRAIVNYVLDLVRKKASYQQNLQKYAEQIRISINDCPARSAFVDDEGRSAAVAYLTRFLQDREAQAFVLRYRDNCSLAEIATRMGVNKRTVSRYLAESLKKLRRDVALD
jgi:RNA polymerase sigma factor (sigma-70 family)